jgi:hypothetical protein
MGGRERPTEGKRVHRVNACRAKGWFRNVWRVCCGGVEDAVDDCNEWMKVS